MYLCVFVCLHLVHTHNDVLCDQVHLRIFIEDKRSVLYVTQKPPSACCNSAVVREHGLFVGMGELRKPV